VSISAYFQLFVLMQHKGAETKVDAGIFWIHHESSPLGGAEYMAESTP